MAKDEIKSITNPKGIQDLKEVAILIERMHEIEKGLNKRGVYIKSIEFEDSQLLSKVLNKEEQ